MSSLQAFANSVCIPGPIDNVYKDECFYSFDSPDCETGLYVCLKTFLGFGKDHVEKFSSKTGNKIFLHIKRTKSLAEDTTEGDAVPEKIVRLAIGVEGGFKGEAKINSVETYSIVTLPNFDQFSIDDQEIPMAISLAVKGILNAPSATRKEELETAAASWEGDLIQESKHAENLLQLENPPKIPPKDWKCINCDLKTNLWLNLTDGAILCGRKFFDGSGGNNHAVEHYRETKYPLAVKLGTITSEGKADVYSYPEDNMVKDPHLQKHLAHFGINMKQLEKTEQSMVEMEIEMNQKFDEWAKLTESGSKLIPVFGPGYTGMENLGNTCYMNSVMQVLFALPPFINNFVEQNDSIFDGAKYSDDQTKNVWLQLAKLGTGLWSGKYSKPNEENDPNIPSSIRPTLFKLMAGRGHPEFSGKGQQDAQEFFLHLLDILDRESKQHKRPNVIQHLQFVVEDRIQCSISKKVRYLTRVEDYLPLGIPMEAATNLDEVQAYKEKKEAIEACGQKIDQSEVVRAKVPFSACLSQFNTEEIVPDFYSTAAQTKTDAIKVVKLKTFPDFLMIQLKKFDVDSSWVPYKLDVEVDMPDEMDLGCLKAKGGLQEGEELLPEDSNQGSTSQAPVIIPDENIVSSLVEMGFPAEGCKKAAYHTNNSGVEAAMIYVMDHMNDADFYDTFVNPTLPKEAFVANPEGLAMLMDMSFTKAQALKALKETSNNVERAVDWIFSHGGMVEDESAAMDTTSPTPPSNDEPGHTDGTRYKLIGFISHMGTSTQVGHYVCHILKDNKWVIFNDSKVAYSENPPKGLGYLYMYQRL